MKFLSFLVLLGLHSAAAVKHSLKNFITGSSQVPNVPEFVAVMMVDDVQTEYYDSNTRRLVPKQDWLSRMTEDDPGYWQRQTEMLREEQHDFKTIIGTLKQTGGVHILQRMYGCEWDDETGKISGYEHYGYDGENLLSFDPETETWTALKQQAEIIKQTLDSNTALIAEKKHRLTQLCPDLLNKFVKYGRNSLMRTDLPSVSLLQMTPSSPVSCFATYFYPDRAEMFWRKDGEKIHENVELGEILPNHDGSFQMSVNLYLSSVAPEHWRRYECVFQLDGVKDDIITKLDKMAIQTNWSKTGSSGFPLGAVIGVVVVLLLLVVCIAGYFLWKNNKKGKDGFQPTNTSDTSGSSAEVPITEGNQ